MTLSPRRTAYSACYGVLHAVGWWLKIVRIRLGRSKSAASRKGELLCN